VLADHAGRVLAAVELIRRTAPFAAGTGIPQAIFASEHLTSANESALFPLVSFRTMTVKVLAILLGIWVGASTGREVRPCMSPFASLRLFYWFSSIHGLEFDMRSAAIAGGAAGLAAAFNTL